MIGIALAFAAAYFVLALTTWIFYLAVMCMKPRRDTMPPTTKKFAYIVLGIGYVLDALFNLASSILFLELPHEFMFTARVSRHIKAGGWRGSLAGWFCANLLEPFDKGHCG